MQLKMMPVRGVGRDQQGRSDPEPQEQQKMRGECQGPICAGVNEDTERGRNERNLILTPSCTGVRKNVPNSPEEVRCFSFSDKLCVAQLGGYFNST